jgi:hypothetical protein
MRTALTCGLLICLREGFLIVRTTFVPPVLKRSRRNAYLRAHLVLGITLAHQLDELVAYLFSAGISHRARNRRKVYKRQPQLSNGTASRSSRGRPYSSRDCTLGFRRPSGIICHAETDSGSRGSCTTTWHPSCLPPPFTSRPSTYKPANTAAFRSHSRRSSIPSPSFRGEFGRCCGGCGPQGLDELGLDQALRDLVETWRSRQGHTDWTRLPTPPSVWASLGSKSAYRPWAGP